FRFVADPFCRLRSFPTRRSSDLWMSVGDFNIGFNLVLDGLSLTMLSVVTGVGFLIHMYASWYMRGEEGYSRFFAYTNLFIASMRSEEHTSELQSRFALVCRLLLE